MVWYETIGGWIAENWLTLLVLGVPLLIFIIYLASDSYGKTKIKKAFKGPLSIILIFLVIWVLLRQFMPPITINLSDLLIPGFGLLFIIVTITIETLKNKTRQFATPNFHDSLGADPIRKNGFLLHPLGGIDADFIKWPYAQRVGVTREETEEVFTDSALSIARMSRVPIGSLPPEIQKEIKTHPYLKTGQDEIWYGWFDDIRKVDWDFDKLYRNKTLKNDKTKLYAMLKENLGVDNPKVSTLLHFYENICKAYNKLEEWYSSVTGSIEEGKEHLENMKTTYGLDSPNYHQRSQPNQKQEEY